MEQQQLDTRTSSVTVKMNAKGDYQWDIKYYFDADTMTEEQVADKIQQLDSEITKRFRGQ